MFRTKTIRRTANLGNADLCVHARNRICAMRMPDRQGRAGRAVSRPVRHKGSFSLVWTRPRPSRSCHPILAHASLFFLRQVNTARVSLYFKRSRTTRRKMNQFEDRWALYESIKLSFSLSIIIILLLSDRHLSFFFFLFSFFQNKQPYNFLFYQITV